MDLGLGGFLEKFESHFGRGLTKALLILIGLAVATFSGSVVWEYLLLPFAQLLPDPKSGPAYEFLKLTLIVAFFLMIVNELIKLADNYQRQKIRRQMKEVLSEAKQHEATGRENLEEAKAILANLEGTMDQVFAHALEHGMLTQAQVDELKEVANL